MAFAPDVNLAEIRTYNLSQYIEATRLNALLTGLIGLFDAAVVDLLEEIDRSMNPEETQRVLLDWVGIRMGLVRPRVMDSSRTYFGLEGTAPQGRPLSQAPFYSADPALAVFSPIPDSTYRCVLFARARKLHGDVGQEAWTACLNALTQVSGQAYIGTVKDFRVTIVTEDVPPAMLQVMQDPVVGPKIMPMIPGVNYVFQIKRISAGNLTLGLGVGQPEGSTTSDSS